MWRVYNSETPTHIMVPSLSVKKGDKIILDTELKIKCLYYVTYYRGEQKEPLKFEVTDRTWNKLAANSKQP